MSEVGAAQGHYGVAGGVAEQGGVGFFTGHHGGHGREGIDKRLFGGDVGAGHSRGCELSEEN